MLPSVFLTTATSPSLTALLILEWTDTLDSLPSIWVATSLAVNSLDGQLTSTGFLPLLVLFGVSFMSKQRLWIFFKLVKYFLQNSLQKAILME